MGMASIDLYSIHWPVLFVMQEASTLSSPTFKTPPSPPHALELIKIVFPFLGLCVVVLLPLFPEPPPSLHKRALRRPTDRFTSLSQLSPWLLHRENS